MRASVFVEDGREREGAAAHARTFGVVTTGGLQPQAPIALRAELASLHEASFGWAMACCGRDRSLAEDVLQDVYFKVLEGRARFGGQSSFKTWLFGVIRMTALESSRSRSRSRTHAGWTGSEQESVADEKPAPDSVAAARERAERLARALMKLADRQREVLHLVFYEDATIAEAAVIMGVALGTARQHYERGKHALAALLGEQR